MSKKGYKQTEEHIENVRKAISKEKVLFTCQYCNATKHVTKRILQTRKFCSLKCMHAAGFSNSHKEKIKQNKLEFYQSARGKKWIEKYSPIISESVKKKYADPLVYQQFVIAMRNSKVYHGGKSFEKYGLSFTNSLRTEIRKMHNDICQLCLRHVNDITQKKLSVHHIDYNKHNSDKNNLLPLCKYCHSKTNFNREYWTKYFVQLQEAKSKYYQHKELLIISTRPDIIKMYPLWLKLKNKAVVINLGQQKELGEETLKYLKWQPDFNLEIMEHGQTLSGVQSKILKLLPSFVNSLNPTRVWVQGDTSSAFAAAMTTFHAQIDIVHIEAGLRSGDVSNPYPEEIYRKMIDTMAAFKFVPTRSGYDNLKRENLHNNAFVTGNTVIDALNIINSKLPDASPLQQSYVLATIHRRESFGNDMFEIFSALQELSTKIKVILPAHPNPNVQKIIQKVGLQTVEPMNYLTFLHYLKHCEFVITDSGGVQEEACSFKKKIIVLRKETERQEAIDKGYGILVQKMEKRHILKQITKFIKTNVIFGANPYGKGDSADKIISIIRKYEKK